MICYGRWTQSIPIWCFDGNFTSWCLVFWWEWFCGEHCCLHNSRAVSEMLPSWNNSKIYAGDQANHLYKCIVIQNTYKFLLSHQRRWSINLCCFCLAGMHRTLYSWRFSRQLWQINWVSWFSRVWNDASVQPAAVAGYFYDLLFVNSPSPYFFPWHQQNCYSMFGRNSWFSRGNVSYVQWSLKRTSCYLLMAKLFDVLRCESSHWLFFQFAGKWLYSVHL